MLALDEPHALAQDSFRRFAQEIVAPLAESIHRENLTVPEALLQPLREMGVIAAETLLQRITAPPNAPYPKEIIVEPSFVVRASTATASGSSRVS